MPEQSHKRLARKSALARFWGNDDHASALAGSVAIRELPHLGVVKLQCRRASPQFLAAVKAVLALDLPLEPNTRTGDSTRALWLAPNEWLLVTEAGEDDVLAKQLASELAQTVPDETTAVTLITDSLVVLSVEGAAASDLIAKGCGLDLHPESFPVGRCASTLLEQVPVVIFPQQERIAYRLLVDRSYAAFAWEWLRHAAKEFEFYP